MSVTAFDHVAIPVANPEEMLRFYRALGFAAITPEEWRERKPRSFAVHFGDNKINMHSPHFWQDPAFTLRGPTAKPGCGDFCFVWGGTLQSLQARLQELGIAAEVGPVDRIGGRDGGRTHGTSIYCRDPDNNLLEFMVYGER